MIVSSAAAKLKCWFQSLTYSKLIKTKTHTEQTGMERRFIYTDMKTVATVMQTYK